MTKLLDCTIRDGGHLIGWNFSEDCVKASYHAAVEAGVDYFEVGYRFQNPKPEWGNFAICDDDFLLKLFPSTDACALSLMINAGECELNKFRECRSELTPVKLVRVATYPDKLPLAFQLCEGLKQKGYKVFLNLMAISEYEENHYNQIKNWNNKNVLDSICFADSFGSFLPSDITKYKEKLQYAYDINNTFERIDLEQYKECIRYAFVLAWGS